MPSLAPLPIDDVLAQVLASFERHRKVVLQAPPGAGKTTRVPAALLDAGLGGAGPTEARARGSQREAPAIVVLEPRRLAARLAARWVAEERGEPLGESVGYEVRFERVAGAATRLLYVTEGILTQRVLRDPDLVGTRVIVLDEFHERHLHGDFALGWIKKLMQTTRPDLGVVVMSATLETARVAAFLDAPTVTSEGRSFPVAIDYAPAPDDRALESRVASALHDVLMADHLDSSGARVAVGDSTAGASGAGHVLVFLPGAAEIRRCTDRCRPLAEKHGLRLMPLHGDLSVAAQDAVVRPSADRKVILATNVAETSVTIAGVTAVIDSGLARVAAHDPWSGRVALEVGKISRASAVQRSGRAGRTAPGRAVRLYTKGDYDTRPEHDVPELLRSDLSELVLWLRSIGVDDAQAFGWLDPPPVAAIRGAEQLLWRLGAIGDSAASSDRALSETGRRMLTLALPPRLARLVVEAERLGVADDGCVAAALLSEGRDLYLREELASSVGRADDEASDLSARIRDFHRARGEPQREARGAGIDPWVVQSVERTYAQLVRKVGPRRSSFEADQADEQLRRAVLAAFPDRVARRKSAAGEDAANRLQTGREVVLSNGGTAWLADTSLVRTAPWLVAIEATDRGAGPVAGPSASGAMRGSSGRPQGTGRRTYVWLASAIEPEWLIDVSPTAIIETTVVDWDSEAERVFALDRMLYDRLVLDERPATSAAAQQQVAALLAERAMASGVASFAGGEAYERLAARLAFVSTAAPDLAERAGLRALDEERVRECLAAALVGKRSFAELKDAALLDDIRQSIGHGALAKLDALAPEHVVLGAGRRVKVQYESGKPPWLASRLQDFFGCRQGPSVLDGRVSVVLNLLAPNGRAVQVTTDLEGFWARTYPGVRSELMRRYPRHAWPTDPLTASPPPLPARRAAGR